VTLTEPTPHDTTRHATGTRAGYIAAIVVNVLLLIVINNVTAWVTVPFLTADVTRVIPIINLSLAATITANAIYLVYDGRWFVALTQLGLLGISMLATVRIYRVFPFDFSSYDVDWALVTRIVLIVAMGGIAVAMVVEAVKFVAALSRD
jgi:hypothetical protein